MLKHKLDWHIILLNVQGIFFNFAIQGWHKYCEYPAGFKHSIMKKIFRTSIIAAIFASFLFACNPNDPSTPDNTDPRDKFVGSWLCNESSHLNGASSFTVTISNNPSNSSQILIANFYQLGTSQKVYGVVAGSNVSIPSQTLSSVTIKGDGSIASNNTKINWNYIADDGADKDTCTAVYSK
jgi:hypothetical protein